MNFPIQNASEFSNVSSSVIALGKFEIERKADVIKHRQELVDHIHLMAKDYEYIQLMEKVNFTFELNRIK